MSNLNKTAGLQKLQDELLKEKAAQMGVQPDELMLKVINGKQIWVKKADVYAQLEKQRNLMAPKQVPRALRGQDSLINQIYREIKFCLELVQVLHQENSINALDLSDHNSFLHNINERSHNIANQLSDIEKNIETIKEADSTFSLAEALLYDMSKAQQAGDMRAVQEMKSQHAGLLKQYEVRRKKLLPFVNSARQLRLEIQKDYWRSLNMRWKILSSSIQYHLNRLIELSKNMDSDQQNKLFSISGQDSRKIAEQIQQSQQNLLKQLPEKKSDLQKVSQQYDKIIPIYVDLLNTMYNFHNDLAKIQLDDLVSVSSSNSNRMAFADKNH